MPYKRSIFICEDNTLCSGLYIAQH